MKHSFEQTMTRYEQDIACGKDFVDSKTVLKFLGLNWFYFERLRTEMRSFLLKICKLLSLEAVFFGEMEEIKKL